MSKRDEETVEEQPKDEQTAKHLHKLAKIGKECGLPACLMAHYETKAWEATKSEEKHTSCEKCGMPPPPPIELKNEEKELTLECKACGEVNKKLIGLESEIAEKTRKEEIVRKREQRQSLAAAASNDNSKNDDSNESTLLHEQRKRNHSPVQRMARKVAPQLKCFLQQTKPSLPLQKNSKKSKKTKIVVEKEPEFLQKLFGIGAQSSN
uniref:Uncharacterized protein n=1 Tax=Caenorhabditis tropicalis TaxID=1561998 RepID=A0A1I7T1K6_9PELO